jgi:EmrB/QacA subfamily drug resistance transporter
VTTLEHDVAATRERAGLAPATLAALLMAGAQAPLGSTMIAVALPVLCQSLGVEPGLATSALVTSYLVVNIIAQSPGGKLADVLGHARTVRLGMSLYAAGALIGLAAPGLALLALSRCIMALGGALVIPATMALLRLHVPGERRGRVFGLVGSIMGLAAALGPPLGGELVARFGWRSIFCASLPFLAAAALLLLRHPAPRDASAAQARTGELARFDWIGSLLLTLALAALVLGSKAHGLGRPLAFALSLVGLFVFVRWEVRRSEPVVDLALFGQRSFSAGSLVIALANFAMYGLLFELPQLFRAAQGTSPEAIGHTLFAMMLAMFVSAPIGGRLNDRIGPRRAALLGIAALWAGCAWLLLPSALASPTAAVPPLVLVGMGVGLSSAPSQAAALSAVPRESAGMAAGVQSTLRYLGGVLSITLLSSITGDGAVDWQAHRILLLAFVAALTLALGLCLALPARALHARRQA